jgi:hypothetical protein
MQALLGRVRADDRRIVRAPENAETRQRQRSLGYLTGTATPKTGYTSADDPNQLVTLDREIDEVSAATFAALSRSARRLAFLDNEAGDHTKAARTVGRALELNPAAAFRWCSTTWAMC